MRVVTFSTLFPNSKQPNFSLFVKHRMAAVKKYNGIDLRVVAPVPYYPTWLPGPQNWRTHAEIPRKEVIDDLEVYHPRYLVTPKIGMRFYALSMYMGALPLLKQMEAETPIDLIDAHFIYPDGLAATMLGKALGKPVVLSARGTDIHTYPQMPSIKRSIRQALLCADRLIAVSCSLAEIMVQNGADSRKITVIPNGIDIEKFYRFDQGHAREKTGLSRNGKMLLTVGALVENKGIALLVDALASLHRQGKLDFITCIVGKGQQKGLLERKIAESGLVDYLKLVGEVPNEELINWYNAADVFFLGSRREGWPNVVCEALACGTPVVATRANGIPEIIKSPDYGMITERNSESFAQAISLSLNKEWDLDKIYRYGQARSWADVAGEVTEVFRKTVGGEGKLEV